MSDTRSDAASAIVTVKANGRNSSPTMPSTNAIGRNTATVVTVDAVIAPATSRTANTIVPRRSAPSTRCRLMFSMTTIESSTTRPIEIVSAPSVSMLSVYSAKFRPTKVRSTEVGIEIAVTRVARTDIRKTRITSTANTSPSRPSTASVSIDCSM